MHYDIICISDLHLTLKLIACVNFCINYAKVISLVGNHDPDKQFNKEYLGVDCLDNIVLESGDKRIFLAHGHQHDEFINDHPTIILIADMFYALTQKIDPSHKLCKTLKKRSKKFLKIVSRIGAGIANKAKMENCQIAIHGHNHNAGTFILDGIQVYDNGCWTEKSCCTYLTVKDGDVEINTIQ